MDIVEEILTEVNISHNQVDLSEDDFKELIEKKYDSFLKFVTNKSYSDDDELNEFIAMCITVNYLNRMQKNLEQGATIRKNDFNTFDINTYLLFDENIKQMIYHGFSLV